MFANLANAGQDGVFQAGRCLMGLNALGVGGFVNEFERINARHLGVHFLKRARFDERMDAFTRTDGKVKFALRADLQVCVQFLVENHGFALRALGPKPLGNVPLFGFARAEFGLFGKVRLRAFGRRGHGRLD